jgi:hypothetical protein
MKIQTSLRAGVTYQQCDAQRNYVKGLVKSGKCVAGYPYPPAPYPPYPPQPVPPPSTGGYVNGVYYPDMSGTCG